MRCICPAAGGCILDRNTWAGGVLHKQGPVQGLKVPPQHPRRPRRGVQHWARNKPLLVHASLSPERQDVPGVSPPGAPQRQAANSPALQPAVQPAPTSNERWQVLERKPLAGGWLELVRWETPPSPRLLRVWLPPGYYKQVPLAVERAGGTQQLARKPAPAGGWPVWYMNDAQNLFEDHLSFSGRSWRAAHTAHQLIKSGELPPFVIVALDHAGAQRSYEYTPYKPGTGPGGWRRDAATWPGGGVWEYVDRLVDEVLPWAESAYSVSSNPLRRGFGGSSFGGICALCMGMRHPTRFGSLLVESPSLWISEEKFLQDIADHKGPWPPRMYVAMGGAEYKGDGGAVFSGMLVAYLERLVAILTAQGVSKLHWEVVPTAQHSESAWAERLPQAWRHLSGHWKQQA